MPMASARRKLPVGVARSHFGTGRVWYRKETPRCAASAAIATIAFDCAPPCETSVDGRFGRAKSSASFLALLPATPGISEISWSCQTVMLELPTACVRT